LLRRLATDVMLVDSNGDRPLQPNYIVLITDGQSDNRDLTWREAMRARARGITVLVVSANKVSVNFLVFFAVFDG